MHKQNITISGKVRFSLYDVCTGKTETTRWKRNLIPTCGRTAIARRLRNAGVKANEGIITYAAVGTGITAPANADTQLASELFRKLVTTINNADNVLTVRIFFTTSEANGNIKEFGLFGEDASGTVDSGTLFERILFTKTKTSSKTLTIEAVLTIS